MDLFFFFIKRSLDYLCTIDFVDSTKIGMFGLSYGRYFSMHTATADTRIISAYKFHDAEVAGLCAPRQLQIDVEKTDAIFDYHPTEYEATRIAKYYDVLGASDNLSFNLWEGGHRFDESCKGFEKFFESLK